MLDGFKPVRQLNTELPPPSISSKEFGPDIERMHATFGRTRLRVQTNLIYYVVTLMHVRRLIIYSGLQARVVSLIIMRASKLNNNADYALDQTVLIAAKKKIFGFCFI